jgi:hypothetical protein
VLSQPGPLKEACRDKTVKDLCFPAGALNAASEPAFRATKAPYAGSTTGSLTYASHIVPNLRRMPPPTLDEPPLVAIFRSDDAASAAIAETQAELMRRPAPGVVLLRPMHGLRERLYASGAALVVP